MSEKLQVYFMPGLAANSKVFEYINLPETHYQIHYLEWQDPLTLDESIESYAKRLTTKIVHQKNLVLIGYSFGGLIVQEMSKLLNPKKIILLSTIKTKYELPRHLLLAKETKVYKIFPSTLIEHIEDYKYIFFTNFLRKRFNLYSKYLSKRNSDYLNWAVKTVLHWKQDKPLENIIHIHGTEDKIFPVKSITSCIPIEGGNHVMVLLKPKLISRLIIEHTNNLTTNKLL